MKTAERNMDYLWILTAIFAGADYLIEIKSLSGIGGFLSHCFKNKVTEGMLKMRSEDFLKA